MESPLAVFLYILMREHLPVATVKWMIDQAKLPGAPKFDAPELEALAQRLADELGELAERPADPAPAAAVPPDPPPPPPAPPASSNGRGKEEASSKPAEETPPKPNPAPARKGESDIELMARFSDYIRAASAREEVVWPRELEAHFNITADRRKRVIDLLVERHRVILLNAGSPRVHYVFSSGAGDQPDFTPGDEEPVDDGEGTATLHLRDPSLARRVEAIADREQTRRFILGKHMDTLREWARGAGNFTAKQISEVFRVSQPTAYRVCSVLVDEGVIEQVSQDGRTMIFAAAQQANGNGNAPRGRPGKRPLHAGGDGSTLDGRALGALDGSGGLTVTELAGRLTVAEETARAVVGRLFKEGEVRPQRQEGIVRYVVV